jgi:hypothetical protein
MVIGGRPTTVGRIPEFQQSRKLYFLITLIRVDYQRTPTALATISPRNEKRTIKRFPAPWTVEAIDAGFKVIDANGQALAYVYGYADIRDAGVANALTLDEARRNRQQWAPHDRLIHSNDLLNSKLRMENWKCSASSVL